MANPAYSAGHFLKPTKMEARMARESKKEQVREKEDRNKSAARKRDGWVCRFPRCVCHRLRLHPECAHDAAKGIGGDHGLRSTVDQLICLCKPRHQESRVSVHKGTLYHEALTEKGTNGPVRWWVDLAAITTPAAYRKDGDAQWVVVATEREVRVLEPLTHEQGIWLEQIAELKA